MTQTGFLDWCDQARTSASKGDYEQARHAFAQALDIKADSADAHMGMGTVCFLQKDFDAAVTHFLEVQRLDPLHAGAAINLGAIYNAMGRYEEAVTCLRRGIQLDPKRSEGYYNLGIAYRRQGRDELAIQAYREAAYLNPRMIDAVYNLANIYFDMQRYEQAVNHYRKALEINPRFTKARNGLANAETKFKEQQRRESGYFEEDEESTQAVSYEHLERTLDPERDHSALVQMHGDTSDLKKSCEVWLRVTEQLDASLRNLGMVLTSNATKSELSDAVRGMRGAIKQFHEAESRFGQGYDHLGKQRDAMAERG